MADREKSDQEASEAMRSLRRFLKEMENVGLQVPRAVMRALDALQLAINTGTDIGVAAKGASTAVRTYEQDLYAACRDMENEPDAACEASVGRRWQARSVNFTLGYRNQNSVAARTIRETLRRYLPAQACAKLDMCWREPSAPGKPVTDIPINPPR
jgi:hypothetical protein